MEMLINRENVSGSMVPTKRVSKLSNYYMDILIKQKYNDYMHKLKSAERSHGSPVDTIDEQSAYKKKMK